MSLVKEVSGVVDGSAAEVISEDNSLESSFHEFGGSKTQDIIELVFVFVQKSHSEASSQECVTFENSSFIIFFKG